MTEIFVKRERFWTQTCTERRTECETHTPTEHHDDRGRDCNDAAASQGTSRIDHHHQNHEEARKDSIRVSEGALPGSHHDFRSILWNFERKHFCFLNNQFVILSYGSPRKFIHLITQNSRLAHYCPVQYWLHLHFLFQGRAMKK